MLFANYFGAVLLLLIVPVPISAGSSVDIKTGLEFLSADASLNLNVKFYLSQLFKGEYRNSTLNLVRTLIRELKGLPVVFQTEANLTQAKSNFWCYDSYVLSYLAVVEVRIYKRLHPLNDPRAKDIKPFPALCSYLNDIEDSSVEPMRRWKMDPRNKDLNSFLYLSTHPLMIYRMIRRFVEDLPHILTLLEANHGQDFVSNLKREALNGVEFVRQKFPAFEDLNNAWTLVTNLQRTSLLTTRRFARGVLGHVKTGVSLTMLHILEIGSVHLYNGVFDYALEWIHLAVNVARKSSQMKRYPQLQEILEAVLDRAGQQHNEYHQTVLKNNGSPWGFTAPVKSPFNPNDYIRRFDQLFAKALELRNNNNTDWNWPLMANYQWLCSGKNLQTEGEKRGLKCYYHVPHEYWQIGPLKAELHNAEPSVVQIYEFTPTSVMTELMNRDKVKLDRSVVAADESEVVSGRTSLSTFITEHSPETAFLANFTRKLELLTGLSISPPVASDDYQVAAYATMTEYQPHLDSFSEDVKQKRENGNHNHDLASGNRLTTVMGYLNDVSVGGRTVFPVLGISLAPIKGSILMWNNLWRNGTEDERTLHGGCPVVLGIKWITNKWIYTDSNFLNHKCALDRYK